MVPKFSNALELKLDLAGYEGYWNGDYPTVKRLPLPCNFRASPSMAAPEVYTVMSKALLGLEVSIDDTQLNDEQLLIKQSAEQFVEREFEQRRHALASDSFINESAFQPEPQELEPLVQGWRRRPAASVAALLNTW